MRKEGQSGGYHSNKKWMITVSYEECKDGVGLPE